MREFSPALDRPDPVALLERQATTRVPELVPIRYGRMLVSPFTFFRGAALIMASDLATTPRSGLTAQVCGDAHLSNFGLFASPERTLMFDVNDFDETLPGPWEWDLKRLAASVVIAARDREFTEKEARAAALEVGAELPHGDGPAGRRCRPWTSGTPTSTSPVCSPTRGHRRQDGIQGRQAHGRAHRQTIVTRPGPGTASRRWSKLTDRGRRPAPHRQRPTAARARPRSCSPQEISDALRDSFHQLLRSYRHSLQSDRRHLLEEFQFVQIARKVVGVGSVGTRAWILLLVGRGQRRPAVPPGQGGRGVGARGVRRARAATPTTASGWWPASTSCRRPATSSSATSRSRVPTASTRDFYLRQLRDWKGSFEIEGSIPPGLTKYAARLRPGPGPGPRPLRRPHRHRQLPRQRADLRPRPSPTFAETYADQNQRDYEALQAAASSGRISVESGL